MYTFLLLSRQTIINPYRPNSSHRLDCHPFVRCVLRPLKPAPRRREDIPSNLIPPPSRYYSLLPEPPVLLSCLLASAAPFTNQTPAPAPAPHSRIRKKNKSLVVDSSCFASPLPRESRSLPCTARHNTHQPTSRRRCNPPRLPSPQVNAPSRLLSPRGLASPPADHSRWPQFYRALSRSLFISAALPPGP